MEFEPLTNKVIGCALEVHKALGPGLLESVYEECLAVELADNDIKYETEKEINVEYKGKKLDCGFRADFVIEGELIVELKAADKMSLFCVELLSTPPLRLTMFAQGRPEDGDKS